MPFFQYTGTDQTGKPVSGTLQAASLNAAQDALKGAGLSRLSVHAPAAAVKVAAPAAPRMVATAPSPARVMSRPFETPSTPVVNVPSYQPTVDIVKTRVGSNKQLFFILTQLSSFYRSGVAPSQALEHLAAKAPKLYKDSLYYAASRVGEGMSLSAALERYPTLYPGHVIGAIRAGEAAGFVPDAVSRMADTVHSAQRLSGKLSYFGWMAAITIMTFPISNSMINGALKSMQLQDAAGGSLPTVPTIVSAIKQQLIANLPIIIALPLLMWAASYAWASYPAYRLRNRIGLTPPLHLRAKVEGLAWTMWSLGMATKAGLPHAAAYQLAVQSIPNLIIREQAIEEAAKIKENEPLSVALAQSSFMPSQYADIVHNGELAGQVPRSLHDIGQAAEADFIMKDRSAAAWMMVVLYIPLGILTLIMAAYLFMSWYQGLFRFMLPDG